MQLHMLNCVALRERDIPVAACLQESKFTVPECHLPRSFTQLYKYLSVMSEPGLPIEAHWLGARVIIWAVTTDSDPLHPPFLWEVIGDCILPRRDT
jgi:hypothetical protein